MRARDLALAVVTSLAGCNLLAGIDEPRRAPGCGDGVIGAGEQCDDGSVASGDGCSAACVVEVGFTCTGQPSVCGTRCGDGVAGGEERCDDGNTVGGDGCSATCTVEAGFSCADGPCAPVCGDGAILGGEGCDDGNAASGDGCSAACAVEHGFTCAGEPSGCASVCGDALVALDEGCDDGGLEEGDGCDASCGIEHGFTCAGEPSGCSDTCGDGVLASKDECDDGNVASGDGCDAACQREPGFTCTGEPSGCAPVCGDVLVVAGEGCDDGNVASGDGCDAICQVEVGYACDGAPSMCAPVCGDGLVIGGEGCDEGDTTAGDCCSASCAIEPGCLFEIEDNDTSGQAAELADGGLLVIGSGRIKGSVDPGDPDYFALDLLPAWSVVRVELFDGSGRDCAGVDTMLAVWQAGVFFPLFSDDNSGIGTCAAVVGNLAGGAYHLRISSAAAVPAYLLEVRSQPSAGSEVEPNGISSQATTVAVSDGYVSGSHPSAFDDDYFAVTVPAGGGSLRAEIIEGAGFACGSMATQLSLYDAATTLRVSTVGGGRGGCSRIDGTGSAPLHPGAHALAAGKYFLRVQSPPGATAAQAVFDYRLSVVVR